ncbi:MAG: hypothetical protein H6564_15545 [Lewinellaceae bacterium]|nr:hypothetical protein [Lewinellaceae bacterium]
MRMTKHWLTTIILACASLPAWLYGQQAPEKLSVRMLGHATGNSIILRWAPLDYPTWDWGNQYGYRLERVTIKQDTQFLSYAQQQQSFVVLDSMLAPLPEMSWQPLAASSDMAGLAAGAIYGEGFMVDTLATEGLMQAYNVNQEQTNRFGFSLFAADQSYAVAEAMGLAYTDTGVTAGALYIYRVRPNAPPSGAEVEAGSLVIGADEIQDFPQPTGLKATAEDKRAQLSWSRSSTDDFYTSFIVERSANNGASFQQVNDKPVIYTTSTGPESNQLFFQDSLPAYGQLYVYRVRGLSPFGISGPASDTVHVVGKPGPIAYRPSITTVEELPDGSVRISWTPPGAFRLQLNGFDVYRAPSHDGAPIKINSSPLSPYLSSYTDNSPLPTAYYSVKATDKNGHLLESFARLMQRKDETPPAPPASLDCSSAANGIARIQWAPNQEPDLKGYRVFMSNQINGEYSQVTDTWLSDTAFFYQLNLNTLSEKVYFKVRALDYRDNQSPYSAACVVERPDIIPPAPPNITEIQPSLNGILLAWVESSSPDVAEYQLLRRKVPGYSWDVLHNWAPGELSAYTDTTVSYQHEYEYRLIAIDDAGLRGSSSPVRARPLDDGVRSAIENLWLLPGHRRKPASGQSQYVIWDGNAYSISHTVGSGQPVARGAAILLWEYPAIPGLHSFLIYRAGADGQFRAYQTVYPDNALLNPANLQELIDAFGADVNINPNSAVDTYRFVDEELKGGQSFKYKVMARYLDGAASPMSRAVVIVY